MEKLVIIILTLAITVFAMPNQVAEQPPTPIVEVPQTALTEQTEEVPEKNTETVDVSKTEEEILVEIEEPTETKAATEERPVVQETPMKTEELKLTEPEKAVKCVDEGDQSLTEYKPQDSGQPNPFENAPQAEIVDHPVEDLIGEGEDRPGEGKHF